VIGCFTLPASGKAEWYDTSSVYSDSEATTMFQEEKTVHPYELRARTAKSLLQRLSREFSSLATEEVDLAKVEIIQRAGIAAIGLRGLAISTACGLLALACLTVAAIVALAIVTSVWVAALIVAALYAIAALVLGASARRVLERATEPAASNLCALVASVKADKLTLEERRSRVESSREQIGQTLAALERKTDLVAPIRDTALGLGSLGVTLSSIVRAGNSER
jgi:Flp pilus assembly protein TadB